MGVILIVNIIIDIILICIVYNTRAWLTQNTKTTKSLADQISKLIQITEYDMVTMLDLVEELQNENIISSDFDIEFYKNMAEGEETDNDNRDSN